MNPLLVVCPKCCAAITAKCTERKCEGGTWGMRFVDYFHEERIEKARQEWQNP